MRIAKSLLVTPGCNFWFGIVAVAISIFVFAYSQRFGPISIIVYYTVWLPLVLVDWRHALGYYAGYWWILGFAVFACLSIFWSAAPSITARGGVQYFSHIVCALIAARTIDIRTLAIGALVGICFVVLFSLAFGVYDYDPIDGTYTFVGAFSSKNQLGFYASLGVYFAFAVIFVLRVRVLWRLFALAAGSLSCYALFASQSATSIGATAATLGVSSGLTIIRMFSLYRRKTVFLVVLVLFTTSVVIALDAGAIDFVLGVFGKDPTLTGRTYLWSEGLKAAQESPLLGVGYYGYWVQGFSEAERLWAEFYIQARSGFSFHNTFIETSVELGFVGLVLIVAIMAGVLVGHLKRLLAERSSEGSFMMFGIALMLAFRSFFEVDILYPYAIGSFLLYYSAALLTRPQTAAVRAEAFSGLGGQLDKPQQN